MGRLVNVLYSACLKNKVETLPEKNQLVLSAWIVLVFINIPKWLVKITLWGELKGKQGQHVSLVNRTPF